MSSCYKGGAPDVPMVHYVVARREDGTGRPLYYVGSAKGWSPNVANATMWPTQKWADAVAAIFPGAKPVRVLMWSPLKPLPHCDDLIGLLGDG